MDGGRVGVDWDSGQTSSPSRALVSMMLILIENGEGWLERAVMIGFAGRR